jgi:hypothetical protein
MEVAASQIRPLNSPPRWRLPSKKNQLIDGAAVGNFRFDDLSIARLSAPDIKL